MESDNPTNEIASITSLPHPQPGQKHRSSGNFSTNATYGKKLRWKVLQDGIENNIIRFHVKKDKKNWWDSTKFKAIGNNKITKFISERSLYISDPDGAAGKSFLVKVYTIR